MTPEKSDIEETRSEEEIKENANKFNEHFTNIGKKTYEKSQECLETEPQNEATPVLDPNREIFKPQPLVLTIKELNNTNAFGSNGMAFRFIKDSLPVLMFYILVIVNTVSLLQLSLKIGNIPTSSLSLKAEIEKTLIITGRFPSYLYCPRSLKR